MDIFMTVLIYVGWFMLAIGGLAIATVAGLFGIGAALWLIHTIQDKINSKTVNP